MSIYSVCQSVCGFSPKSKFVEYGVSKFFSSIPFSFPKNRANMIKARTLFVKIHNKISSAEKREDQHQLVEVFFFFVQLLLGHSRTATNSSLLLSERKKNTREFQFLLHGTATLPLFFVGQQTLTLAIFICLERAQGFVAFLHVPSHLSFVF